MAHQEFSRVKWLLGWGMALYAEEGRVSLRGLLQQLQHVTVEV